MKSIGKLLELAIQKDLEEQNKLEEIENEKKTTSL